MPCEITVKYFGFVRAKTGREEESIEVVDGATLKDLVRFLCERYGIDQALISNCFITVNARGAAQLAGAETELRPGDRICFMPPLSGG